MGLKLCSSVQDDLFLYTVCKDQMMPSPCDASVLSSWSGMIWRPIRFNGFPGCMKPWKQFRSMQER